MSELPRDPANARATVTLDCSALAELCRADEKQQRDPSFVSDGVPLPIEDEPITRPYPNEVYAQMMMQAVSVRAEPSSFVLPERTLTLPTARSMHRQVMETVLMIAGAIVLPIVTLWSLQFSHPHKRSGLAPVPEILTQAVVSARDSAAQEVGSDGRTAATAVREDRPSAESSAAPAPAPKRAPKPARADHASAVKHPAANAQSLLSVPPPFEIEE
jgi:hypothetical protein